MLFLTFGCLKLYCHVSQSRSEWLVFDIFMQRIDRMITIPKKTMKSKRKIGRREIVYYTNLHFPDSTPIDESRPMDEWWNEMFKQFFKKEEPANSN
jgi:hypothetical protein